jgi:hypothetical protein
MGDLNGDGWLDIVAVLPQFDRYVFLNDGAGGLGRDHSDCTDPPVEVICLPGFTNETKSPDLADLNGNGALDILACNELSPPSYACFNLAQQAVRLTFSDRLVIGDISDAACSIDAADVTDDGSLDVIIGRQELQNAVYLNNGKGDFAVSGMQVSTWFNGQMHGQTLTLLEGDQVVYSIQISGVEPGAPVTFQINGLWAPHSTVWDNTHCFRFDLLLAELIKYFLPLISTTWDIYP